MESLICNFYLSVAASKIEQIRPWDTLACCRDVKQPTNNWFLRSFTATADDTIAIHRQWLPSTLSPFLCFCLSWGHLDMSWARERGDMMWRDRDVPHRSIMRNSMFGLLPSFLFLCCFAADSFLLIHLHVSHFPPQRAMNFSVCPSCRAMPWLRRLVI